MRPRLRVRCPYQTGVSKEGFDCMQMKGRGGMGKTSLFLERCCLTEIYLLRESS